VKTNGQNTEDRKHKQTFIINEIRVTNDAANFFGKIRRFPLDFSTLVFGLKLKGVQNWLKSAKKLIIFDQNVHISAQKVQKNAHFCNFPLLRLCCYLLSTYIVFWRNSHLTKCPIAPSKNHIYSSKTTIRHKVTIKFSAKTAVF